MRGFVAGIEDLTEANDDFRNVLHTGKNLQVVNSLKPSENIGMETHATHDQFFRVEKSRGDVVIAGITQQVKSGIGIVVPAGALHNRSTHTTCP